MQILTVLLYIYIVIMPISENLKPAKQLKPFKYVYDAVDFDHEF